MSKRSRRRRSAVGNEGSLLLAILMTLIVTTLVFVTATVTIAGQQKTRDTRYITFAQQAADAAINDALMWGNTYGDRQPTPPTDAYSDPAVSGSGQRSGSIGSVSNGTQVNWSWTAFPNTGPSTSVGKNYLINITTTTTAGKVLRQWQDTITGTQIVNSASGNGATNGGGSLHYFAAPLGGFGVGFFADQEVILRGNAHVQSYNDLGASATSGSGTGNGRLSTNGSMSLEAANAANLITLYDGASNAAPDRCLLLTSSTSMCNGGAIPVQTSQAYYATSGSCSPSNGVFAGSVTGCPQPTKVIDQACQNQTITPWVASEHLSGGTATLNATNNGICYSSMVFDAPVTVVGTTSTPVRIYVTGDISVNPTGTTGLTVNSGNSDPIAYGLQIFSKGQHVTIQGGTSTATPTQVGWGLWAPNADCGGASTTGSVNVFGAMICKRLTAQNNWTLYYDEQAQNLSDSSARWVYEVTGYSQK